MDDWAELDGANPGSEASRSLDSRQAPRVGLQFQSFCEVSYEKRFFVSDACSSGL
jgi:hypothetical protein